MEMTKRRRRVQKLPGTVHLLPALAMCTAQGNPSYRPPTQLRSREDAEIVSRFVPASPRGQSASRHRSGHLWPRSPPTAGRSASRHQYTDARELLHGYHSSNIAGGGGRHARGARAGRRAGRRLSRPICSSFPVPGIHHCRKPRRAYRSPPHSCCTSRHRCQRSSRRHR